MSSRYERTTNLDDLEAAISWAQDAVHATPLDHPDRAGRLNNLSSYLSGRYERIGNLDDLEAAISRAQDAVHTTPLDHPDRSMYLNNLSNRLSSRYERTGNLDALEAAISRAQDAIQATPLDYPDRSIYLSNLSSHLFSRYERIGNLDDLEAAISRAQDVIQATPLDHPDRVDRLNNLSSYLSGRYKRIGNLDDLEAAISWAQDAIQATPLDHPDRSMYLNNLSNRLSSRYERTGNLDALEAAISRAQDAVQATPLDHPDRSMYLSNLSSHIFSRYERIGNLDDLKAAISRAQDAMQATPLNHPDRSMYLSNLSSHLSSRYERIGNLDDLEAAISWAQDAIQATPLDHPDRSKYLNNLSSYLSSRYQRIGNLDDLEAAISRAQDAIQATPLDHPDRSIYLSNLSSDFSRRYERIGNLDDLEAAISQAQDAVQATPLDYPERAGRLNNLSSHLSGRYQRTGNLDDLEIAISWAQNAVQATPLDHPDRSMYLNNLSTRLSSRYDQTGNLEDLEAAISQAQDALSSDIAIPFIRVIAARRLLRILTKHGRWDHASSIAETTTELLPLLCSRHLSRQDQQYAITQTAGLAADICTIFHHQNKPNQALQHLEFGRGLILGYLIDSRSDVDQLHKDYPHLATKYDYLRRTLSQPLPSGDSEDTAHLVERKKEASRELEDCLYAIRQELGYTRFLLEPEVHTLTAEAAEGPLVAVNITDLGSHASIVVGDQIHSLELPQMLSLRHSGLNHQLARFRAVGQRGPRDVQSELEASHPPVRLTESYYDAEALSWLWDHCVKPILEFIDGLASAPTDKCRIWWMGTGAASCLPFHAAGYHDDSLQNTMGCAISSYVPSIKALAYSRSRLSKLPAHDAQTSLAIMTMPTTPQETSLPGIVSEVKAIEDATAGSEFTLQVQRYPQSEAVLQAMQETDIIHFACHGSSDANDPSEGHLLFQKDGPTGPLVDRLTVQQISDRMVERARIAFLSACSTAEITAGKFTDEAIHLASAFQVAGFGHVIASLWSVKDAVCAPVAYYFYHHLAQQTTGSLSNRSIAEALHGAVLKIRENESPNVWASFVHYGA